MNKVISPRQRQQAWSTGLVGAAGLAVIAGLTAWLILPGPSSVSGTEPTATEGAAPAGVNPAAVEGRRRLAASGRWSLLPEKDRLILAPLEEDWSELSSDQRLKWLDLAQRFPTLGSEERQRVQARMVEWARMSPIERGTARLNFQEIRQLPNRDRLERWEAYQDLAPAERKELAQRAQSAAPTAATVPRLESVSPVPKSSAVATEAVAAASTSAKPVGGTVVQAPLGATTTLVTRLPTTPPSPSPAGPKIAATPDVVDPATLLPQARAAARPATPDTPRTGEEPASTAPAEPSSAPPGAGTAPSGNQP